MNKQHDILLLTPPYWSVYTPFLAAPCLSAVLKEKGYKVEKLDLNILHFNNLLRRNALRQTAFMMKEFYFDALSEQEKVTFECSNYEGYKKKSAFLRMPNFSINKIKNIMFQLDHAQMCILDMFLARVQYTERVAMPKKITRQSILDSFDYLDTEELARTLYESDVLNLNIPSVVGLCVTAEQQLLVALFYKSIIEKMYPHIKYVLGGSYIDFLIKTKSDEELAVLFSFADYLSFNEGETCLCKLMDYLVLKKGKLADIPNLVYFEDGTVKRTDSCIEDFSALPAPDFSDVPFEQYLFPENMIPYQTSRGCFYGQCAFCSHEKEYRTNYRVKSVETVISELKELKSKHDIGHICFVDEAIHHDYVASFVNALEKEVLLGDLKWMYYSRVSRKYTPEIVEKAYKCGCRMVLFGVETFNQRVLNHIKKGISAETSIENIKLFHEHGISVYIWMMSALPTQTKKEMLDDLAKMEEMQPYLSGLALGPFGLYKGCEMCKDPESYGIIKWDEFNPLQFTSAYEGIEIDRKEIDETFYEIIEPKKNGMGFNLDRFSVYARSLYVNEKPLETPDCEELIRTYSEKCILSDENPKGNVAYYESRIQKLKEEKNGIGSQHLNYKKLHDDRNDNNIEKNVDSTLKTDKGTIRASKYLLKLIKKIALLFPPVKTHYQNYEKLIANQTDYEMLTEKNKALAFDFNNVAVDLCRMRTYVAFLEKQISTNIADKKICPACKKEFLFFLPGGEVTRQNAVCPYCETLERFRTFYLFFENQTDLFSENAIKLLHFAPERCLYDKFITISTLDYYPVDFNPSFYGIRDTIDIQNIKYEDNMFDAIICNHVLEHVPDDYAAMKELRRVLKKDGVAYITVPFFIKCDVTLEDPAYNTDELRRQHYSSFDHYRQYGNDFVERLQNSGFNVCKIEPNKEFIENELSRYGLICDEIIFKCTLR